jgi:hypothetical protein
VARISPTPSNASRDGLSTDKQGAKSFVKSDIFAETTTENIASPLEEPHIPIPALNSVENAASRLSGAAARAPKRFHPNNFWRIAFLTEQQAVEGHQSAGNYRDAHVSSICGDRVGRGRPDHRRV